MASDVDEEVYVGDGVEGQEAQEASAGNRRAIAGADQAGQLDISGETKAARTLRTPEPPTDAARMAHNATHVPLRDWCPFCVASRGRSSSAQTSCGEQNSGHSAEVPGRLHVHRDRGREQNSAMHHIRGTAQWSSDQLRVRTERWLRGLDEGNPTSF